MRDDREAGKQRRALGRAEGDGDQSAAADLAQELRQVAEHHVAVAGDDVLDGRRTAAIGHVQEIHAGHRLEQLTRKVL